MVDFDSRYVIYVILFNYEATPQQIPVITNFRPKKFDNNKYENREKVLITIKPNIKEKQASLLPTVSVINARSLWPKIDYFVKHFKETKSNLAIISEIWGKGSK